MRLSPDETIFWERGFANLNLTIVTTNQLNAQPAAAPVLFQVPMYPVADDVSQHGSLHDFAEGFLLTRAAMAWFDKQYAGDPQDARHTPMVADCADTPPTAMPTSMPAVWGPRKILPPL